MDAERREAEREAARLSLRFCDGHRERDTDGELRAPPSVNVDAVFRSELNLGDVVDLPVTPES